MVILTYWTIIQLWTDDEDTGGKTSQDLNAPVMTRMALGDTSSSVLQAWTWCHSFTRRNRQRGLSPCLHVSTSPRLNPHGTSRIRLCGVEPIPDQHSAASKVSHSTTVTTSLYMEPPHVASTVRYPHTVCWLVRETNEPEMHQLPGAHRYSCYVLNRDRPLPIAPWQTPLHQSCWTGANRVAL
jgi:hypothetical protein